MLLRYTLLALLDRQELHGYAIKAAFEERVGPYWALNFGQIYQGLKELKRRGLVVARFDAGDGHLGRWLYAVTPKGRRALSTWLGRSPRKPGPFRDEILVRLIALNRHGSRSALDQIINQERLYRAHVGQLSADTRVGNDPLRALVRDAHMFHAEAHLRWLDHCRATFECPPCGDEST